jgi:hypothetical protein
VKTSFISTPADPVTQDTSTPPTSEPPQTWEELLADADKVRAQYRASHKKGRQTMKEMLGILGSIKSNFVSVIEIAGIEVAS